MSIGALIVYDITDQDSFNKMSQWVKELRQQVGSELPIIVVGNKCDMESRRVVQLSKAEEYAKQMGLEHFSASAKTGHNV